MVGGSFAGLWLMGPPFHAKKNRYVVYPSERKPEVDSEFLSWHASEANWSKVGICEEAQRPWSARAGIRSHQIRDMGAGKAGKAAKFRKLDLTNAIIDKDLMTAA